MTAYATAGAALLLVAAGLTWAASCTEPRAGRHHLTRATRHRIRLAQRKGPRQ